ncbi:hypothetical protein TNCV_2943151 [Trichonephila clavipes]|nr:hypothetical protein TNCV_2943151 [Trichonephila clavipes]
MPFTRKLGSGHPRKTSYREDHHIVRNARVQSTASSAAIQAQQHNAPTARVMVWSAIAYNTRSLLLLIRGTMTAQRNRDAEKVEYHVIEVSRSSFCDGLSLVVFLQKTNNPPGTKSHKRILWVFIRNDNHIFAPHSLLSRRVEEIRLEREFFGSWELRQILLFVQTRGMPNSPSKKIPDMLDWSQIRESGRPREGS